MTSRILSADKIRHRLKELRWSQSDLARATGLTTAAISKLMSNPNPLLSSALRIADALGVDLDELLEEEQAEPVACSA